MSKVHKEAWHKEAATLVEQISRLIHLAERNLISDAEFKSMMLRLLPRTGIFPSSRSKDLLDIERGEFVYSEEWLQAMSPVIQKLLDVRSRAFPLSMELDRLTGGYISYSDIIQDYFRENLADRTEAIKAYPQFSREDLVLAIPNLFRGGNPATAGKPVSPLLISPEPPVEVANLEAITDTANARIEITLRAWEYIEAYMAEELRRVRENPNESAE